MYPYKHRSVWLALLVTCLVSGGAAQEKSDDAALRALVTQLFTAYANKDLTGWRHLWSPRAPELEGRAQQLRTRSRHFGIRMSCGRGLR